jgi:hypothetical protein
MIVLYIYIALGIIYALVMLKITLGFQRQGEIPRNVLGEIIFFVAETIFWPIFIAIKLAYEKRRG